LQRFVASCEFAVLLLSAFEKTIYSNPGVLVSDRDQFCCMKCTDTGFLRMEARDEGRRTTSEVDSVHWIPDGGY
jgi:hypothetical protein